MKKLLYTALLLFPILTFSQVGIGTTVPAASLDITNTSKGILIPRMTQAQRNLIGTPATGLMIYQTDSTPGFYYYNGSAWQSLSSSSWSTTGNAGTNPASNKLGTTDNQDLSIVTNNVEGLRISSTGNVGIGTTTPATKLHIVSSGGTSSILNDGFEDNTIPPFTTGGNVNWLTQNTTVKTGTRAARSGAIGDNQTSWIQYSVTVPAQGAVLSFAYNIDTEYDADFYKFYINNVQQGASLSGTIGWTTVTYNLTSGTYPLKWEYSKDFSTAYGADRVNLDDIVITANAVPAGLQIQDGLQAAGKVLVSDATGKASWGLPIPGSADDDWRWNSGYTVADPIYHVGGVFVGTGATTSPYNIKFWNNAATGTRVDLGSVEYFIDDVNELRMSDFFTPKTNNAQDMGTATNRWTAVYAALGTINTSDERLKENIVPIQYGLNEILKLKPVSFKWKQEKEDAFVIPNNKKETKLGLIAQDVQKVIPDVITDKQWYVDGEHPEKGLMEIEAERLGISYSELIPVTIKAIQEQQHLIDGIKTTNENLKKAIEKLKNKKGAN